MSGNPTGGAAFPRPPGGGDYFGTQGMSLRDWFAGQAAPMIWERLHKQLVSSNSAVDDAYAITATAAYQLADALIAEREK